MSKTLQVIKPFLFMNVGDTFELCKDGKSYITEINEEVNKNDTTSEVESSFYSKFTISANYAKSLMEDGYLCDVEESNSKFVNVFDEIDNLLAKYNKDLCSVDEEFKSSPACLKVEKTTVLKNLIKVLTYLKGLKK